MKRFFGYLACVLVGALLAALGMYLYTRYQSPSPSVQGDTCLLQECLNGSVAFPIAELEERERITLIELSLEQIRLERLLGSMVTRFGTGVQPFAAAWRVEQGHTVQFSSLFDKYGVTTPVSSDSGLGNAPATSTRAACVQALDQVRHLQERLFNERNAFVSRPDIRRVIQMVAQDSRDTLQPAFERCAKEE